MRRIPTRRLRTLAAAIAIATGLAACAVHDSTAAATSILGYWSAETTRSTIALELREQVGSTLAGRCIIRTPTRTEACNVQVAYVDSTFRTTLVTFSYRWTLDARRISTTEVRGRLTGATFEGPMDETVTFVKSPHAHPLLVDPGSR